ncbi:MAG: putative zinc-binding protein [Methanomassiliicoccales archaeon]|nr:putative zinc-binding protein [Methanomassiliicoccales archaeon]
MSAKSADLVIALDGCQVECARKVLEHAGVKPGVHIVATELGLTKKVDERWTEEQVQVIDQALSIRMPRRSFPE